MYGLDKLNKIITIRKIILSFLINNYNQDLFAKSNLTYQKVIDSSDKLVAIKQIIKRSNVSLDDILTSMEERFNYVSSSNNVYWYRHEGVMTARVEKTATETIIRFAKDANIMMQYFPWE